MSTMHCCLHFRVRFASRLPVTFPRLHDSSSLGTRTNIHGSSSFSVFLFHTAFRNPRFIHNRIKHYKPTVESDGSVLHEKTKIREELCSRFFENKRVFLLQKRDCLLQELEETIKKLHSTWKLGNLRLLSYLTGIISRQLLVNNACLSLVSYRHQFCICIKKTWFQS